MSHYSEGDIVNGHALVGNEWVPLATPLLESGLPPYDHGWTAANRALRVGEELLAFSPTRGIEGELLSFIGEAPGFIAVTAARIIEIAESNWQPTSHLWVDYEWARVDPIAKGLHAWRGQLRDQRPDDTVWSISSECAAQISGILSGATLIASLPDETTHGKRVFEPVGGAQGEALRMMGISGIKYECVFCTSGLAIEKQGEVQPLADTCQGCLRTVISMNE